MSKLYERPNRKIYSIIEWPTFALEPQQAIILNTIDRLQPVSRAQLVVELQSVMETKRNLSTIVSFHIRTLARSGIIRVEDPFEHAVRVEVERRTKEQTNTNNESQNHQVSVTQ